MRCLVAEPELPLDNSLYMTKIENENNLSFGMFADAHYAEGLFYGDRECDRSLRKLKKCMDIFHDRRLPFAVNLGDIIDHVEDSKKNLSNLEAVRLVLSESQSEIYTVIGNHDVATWPKQLFMNEIGSGRVNHYSFDREGCHFVVLDSNSHRDGADYTPDTMPKDWGDAWLAPDQLEWLAEDLSVHHDAVSFVFCHANIDYREYLGDRDPHVLCNHADIRAVIEREGNVRAVIQGHFHEGCNRTVNGIHYLTIPAMCRGVDDENPTCAVATLDTDRRRLTLEIMGSKPTSAVFALS